MATKVAFYICIIWLFLRVSQSVILLLFIIAHSRYKLHDIITCDYFIFSSRVLFSDIYKN